VVARWKEVSCTRGFVLASSERDVCTYTQYGFAPHNAMVIELCPPSPQSVTAVSEGPTSVLHLPPPKVAAAALAVGTPRPVSPPPSPPSSPRPSLPPTLTREEPEAAVPLSVGGAELSVVETEFVAAVRASGTELASQYSPQYVASLRLALPQMLQAALPASDAGAQLLAAVSAAQSKSGTYIDPENNWFTRNVVRFGAGFDMKALTAEPGMLASKFDRLSNKYDQWTVGNQCTYYHWLARASRSAADSLRSAEATVLDVACGIGLPGHTLRLCSFEGRMLGTDISPGMLSLARERRVYDRLFVANANEGLALDESSIDLVVCVGAMELLEHRPVLAEFARILRPPGQLWASFQWEDAIDEDGVPVPSPTAHQNVVGVTLPQLMAELEEAGFDAKAATIEKSACAFYTPSPKQDGSLLAVPYLYVTAGLRA